MSLLNIQTTGRAAFVSGIEKWTQATKDGISEGLQRAGEEFLEDLAGYVPVKTGQARASLGMQIVNQLKVVVGYGKEVTWKMKIVELSGAAPHPIIPRGRLGSRDSRRVGAFIRSHPQISRDRLAYVKGDALKISPIPAGKLSLMLAMKGAGIDTSKYFSVAKQALTISGGLYSWAPHHPGSKPAFVLRARLHADADKIITTVRNVTAEKLHE